MGVCVCVRVRACVRVRVCVCQTAASQKALQPTKSDTNVSAEEQQPPTICCTDGLVYFTVTECALSATSNSQQCHCLQCLCLQCFGAGGLAAGRASGL